MLEFLKANKYYAIAAGVLGFGAYRFVKNKRDAQAQAQAAQAAQDQGTLITAAPFSVATLGAGSLGGGGLSAGGALSPFSTGSSDGAGVNSIAAVGSALTGGSSTSGGGGNGMYDYLLRAMTVQSSSDQSMLMIKGQNDQALANIYGMNDLNLAQNSSLTFLGQTISKQGGNISLNSDLKGNSTLSVFVAPTFEQSQTLRTQTQQSNIVKSLYETIAGKTPDAGGEAYWNYQLNSGKSLDSVLSSFKSAVNETKTVSSAVQAGNAALNGQASTVNNTPIPNTYYVPAGYAGTLPSNSGGPTPVLNSGNGMNYVDTNFTGAVRPAPSVTANPIVTKVADPIAVPQVAATPLYTNKVSTRAQALEA